MQNKGTKTFFKLGLRNIRSLAVIVLQLYLIKFTLLCLAWVEQIILAWMEQQLC